MFTSTNFCPHCDKHTEHIRILLEKFAIYVCFECWRDTTDYNSPTENKEVIRQELERLLKKS